MFREVSPGKVEVTVRRVGFAPTTVVLEVQAFAVTEIEISLQPGPTVLDPVIESATRDARSSSEVAAAVSVADTSMILRQRTVGLHETLRMMPGVQVSSRYGTDDVNIGIRGSAARARQAVRGVAVLLDGVPLTEPDGVARLDLIELAASRQVEVLRGPVSALYAGSPNGVVNVLSRTGRDSRGFSARAMRGAFGFQKYDGQAGGVTGGGRASGYVAASYTSTDGYRDHSDASILRAQLSLDYVASPGSRVAIQAHGSHLDSHLPGSQNHLQLAADPSAAAPTALTADLGRGDDRYRLGAKFEQSVGSGIASGYFFYGGRTLDFPIATQVVDLNLHRIQGGVRLRAERVARKPLDATAGLDYDNIFGSDRRPRNDQGVRGTLLDDGYFSVPNIGAYSQADWQVARTAGVSLGLRYDRVRYQFESHVAGLIPKQAAAFDQLSPKLSILLRPGAGMSFYASAGRGFEVPAVGELSASPGAQLSMSLQPKSLWNYEVGGRHIAADRVLFEGSAFYADVRGEFVPRTVDNISRPENASRSRNLGVELAINAKATPYVELATSYSFLDQRLTDYTTALLGSSGVLQEVDFSGKILPGVPRHRFTSEIRLDPLASVNLGAQLEWQSVAYVESSNSDEGIWYVRGQAGAPAQQVVFRAVPARTLVHLNATWRIGSVTLFSSVENLFKVKYAGNILANEALGRFYESGSPRWVSVGLRLSVQPSSRSSP